MFISIQINILTCISKIKLCGLIANSRWPSDFVSNYLKANPSENVMIFYDPKALWRICGEWYGDRFSLEFLLLF